MMFVWGVLVTLAVGVIVGMLMDSEIRDAAVTLAWAALYGPPVLLALGVARLLRLLPVRWQPRMVRGRRLSTKALQRVALHADVHGWSISRPATSIIIVKRGAK